MPKYLPVDQPQATRSQAVLSELAPDLDISSERPALTITTCCLFHCGQCLRCFKVTLSRFERTSAHACAL